METDSGIKIQELRVDGGATRDSLLMQIQSDLLGVAVVRPKVSETTALGAAYLAGLAVGYWKDAESLRALWQADQRYLPGMEAKQREGIRAGWAKALTRAKNWVEPSAISASTDN
jgi:glycerol kinase